MSNGNLCLLCKHFTLDLGDRGWGSTTPGYPGEAYCEKRHWSIDSCDCDAVARLRVNMPRAETCEDYEYYKEVQDEIPG